MLVDVVSDRAARFQARDGDGSYCIDCVATFYILSESQKAAAGCIDHPQILWSVSERMHSNKIGFLQPTRQKDMCQVLRTSAR